MRTSSLLIRSSESKEQLKKHFMTLYCWKKKWENEISPRLWSIRNCSWETTISAVIKVKVNNHCRSDEWTFTVNLGIKNISLKKNLHTSHKVFQWLQRFFSGTNYRQTFLFFYFFFKSLMVINILQSLSLKLILHILKGNLYTRFVKLNYVSQQVTLEEKVRLHRGILNYLSSPCLCPKA